MSDPVTNVEIEDVLSSIRRLVSEETRPSAEAQQDAVPEKLVLTPAFRVQDDQDDTVAKAEPAQPIADDTDVTDVLYEMADDQDAAQDEWAEDSWAEDIEEDAPESAASDVIPDTITDKIEDVADLAAIADVMTTDQGVAEAYEANATEETFEAEEAEAGTVAQPQTESLDESADDTVEDALSETDTADLTASDRVSMLQDVMPDAEDEWQTSATSEPVDPEQGYDEDVAEPDAWEDVDGFDAAANTVPFIKHAAAYSDTSEPEASIEDTATPAIDDDPEVFMSDEAVLDEEALRDLVSELVREELQGALGERITRNVRKLVRREIHRALTSMELE